MATPADSLIAVPISRGLSKADSKRVVQFSVSELQIGCPSWRDDLEVFTDRDGNCRGSNFQAIVSQYYYQS